jgi:hypothetical protein
MTFALLASVLAMKSSIYQDASVPVTPGRAWSLHYARSIDVFHVIGVGAPNSVHPSEHAQAILPAVGPEQEPQNRAKHAVWRRDNT